MPNVSMGGNDMKTRLRVFFVFAGIVLGLAPIRASAADGQPLRIAYTSIGISYGPLWLTKEAGIFKKYDIDAEILYIAGWPLSTQALIAGNVSIAFASAVALISANLSSSDLHYSGGNHRYAAVPALRDFLHQRAGAVARTKLGVPLLGTPSDFIAHYLLRKWGLQPDKDVAIFQADLCRKSSPY